jgi:hypothetical protein
MPAIRAIPAQIFQLVGETDTRSNHQGRGTSKVASAKPAISSLLIATSSIEQHGYETLEPIWRPDGAFSRRQAK